ncbi:PD-(D/E)XK nuclease family transposase [Butyrivibrio sp. YAB3001]|uniref:PD-(D/E)XK nuclease family transposase n=1 Tax=Butyrivibrio sp. YAB3001 TaxID=1520812 RepID=UPI0008F61FA0|nr:PD-(D/E)XK nuclease family transposase [Butyrivibrio sp. YAB3001]SFC26878.1 conserved hypothetical protein (putative transposase or invertase) [Butyrivibrio sp. YAB3001]
MSSNNLNISSYQNATGTIEFSLTSDIMLHYVMQQSKRALKGLVCSLKGIDPSMVKDILVQNPIDLNALQKETVMDLKLLLNNGEILNIELQMYTDKYWILRSILYLCRAFDSLKEGEDYSHLMPTTHFCITNQELFPDNPEFYAHFLLMNTKNHIPYTKNFALNVLQLNHTDLATDEDINNNVVYWAKLFNATTWEEFKALAKGNDAIEEVGDLMYTINADDQTREILEGQRRYREQSASQYTAGFTDAEEQLMPIIEEDKVIMANQNATIANQEAIIADKDATIADQDIALANLNLLLQKYKDKYGEI